MRLDYDKLVADYVESLQAKLRNFAVEPEFLGMWVHDEDDHKSLYEMFLAAKGAGRPALTVSLGAATWNRLDEARLSRDLGLLGPRTVVAHAVAITPADVAELFQPGSRNAICTRGHEKAQRVQETKA